MLVSRRKPPDGQQRWRARSTSSTSCTSSTSSTTTSGTASIRGPARLLTPPPPAPPHSRRPPQQAGRPGTRAPRAPRAAPTRPRATLPSPSIVSALGPRAIERFRWHAAQVGHLLRSGASRHLEPPAVGLCGPEARRHAHAAALRPELGHGPAALRPHPRHAAYCVVRRLGAVCRREHPDGDVVVGGWHGLPDVEVVGPGLVAPALAGLAPVEPRLAVLHRVREEEVHELLQRGPHLGPPEGAALDHVLHLQDHDAPRLVHGGGSDVAHDHPHAHRRRDQRRDDAALLLVRLPDRQRCLRQGVLRRPHASEGRVRHQGKAEAATFQLPAHLRHQSHHGLGRLVVGRRLGPGPGAGAQQAAVH
mmetsp:Transcript_85859/g.243529  ORF Transcript_85859/g.243529 Transcript_85859/m.243529 type:complete len:362 (+) Transcript_85859:417-1502(+)